MSNIGRVTDAGNISETIAADKTLKGNKAASYFNKNTSSLKKDTLSLSNKISKKGISKKGLIAGAIAALGIAAGIIYNGVKTGKFQGLIEKNVEGDKVQKEGKEIFEEPKIEGDKVQKEGKEILEESKDVFNEIRYTIDEAADLLKKGQENGFQEVKDESGNVIIRFVDAAYVDPAFNIECDCSNKVMEEFDASGVLKRSINFDPDDLKIRDIKKYVDSTGKKYDLIEADRLMYTMLKGVEEFGDGFGKVKKCFYFDKYGKNRDKLFNFRENLELSADSMKTKKEFFFKDGKLNKYYENQEFLAGGSGRTNKYFEFDDSGKIIDYTKDKMFLNNAPL